MMKLDKHSEINLKDYISLFKQRLWIVILIMLLTGTAGYLYSNYNYTALYQASTRVIFGSGNEDMNTLMVMIKDPIVIERVKQELELTKSAEGIAGQIEVTRIDDSQVVRISVTDENPVTAANIANATAKAYKNEIVNILSYSDVQLLSPAKENSVPINETKYRTIILATIAGLIIGIGMIFLLDSLDEKVRKASEVEEILNVPALGSVPNMKKRKYLVDNKVKKQKEVVGGGKVDGIKQEA